MKGKKVSANFALFIISFLVFITVLVFALLLFLSYENMHNSLVIETEEDTSVACRSLASDIEALTFGSGEPVVFTQDNDGSGNFELTKIVERYITAEIYRDYGAVYIIDEDGLVLLRNVYVENDDAIRTYYSDNGRLYIKDENVMELIGQEGDDLKTFAEDEGSYVTAIAGKHIQNTEYFVVVKKVETAKETVREYVENIFRPAVIALVSAVVLYALFVWLSLKPVRNISEVIKRVAEGDYTARVDAKYTNENDYSNFSVSSEFDEMGATVNNMIESLQNQEKDREIFISSVAHDIRTPLTSINGFVTAMLDGTISDEDRPKYLNLIKQQVGRIKALVTSMTEASSLSHVNRELMEEFNVSDMINDVIENLETQFADKDIHVIKSLDPGPGIIAYGEPAELARVINNIVTNAIKFTPAGGTIKISTETDKKQRKIFITVEDSGPGIEESKRKRIFESFYKGDPSRKQEGFGLGLYICKQILLGHRQTIVCEEGTELGGAKFVFSFPYPPEEI